jgi:hypothetical protein
MELYWFQALKFSFNGRFDRLYRLRDNDGYLIVG